MDYINFSLLILSIGFLFKVDLKKRFLIFFALGVILIICVLLMLNINNIFYIFKLFSFFGLYPGLTSTVGLIQSVFSIKGIYFKQNIFIFIYRHCVETYIVTPMQYYLRDFFKQNILRFFFILINIKRDIDKKGFFKAVDIFINKLYQISPFHNYSCFLFLLLGGFFMLISFVFLGFICFIIFYFLFLLNITY